MKIVNQFRGSQQSAHDFVPVQVAQDQFTAMGTDRPVSGDQSVIDYGRIGMRRNAWSQHLWSNPGVASSVGKVTI